MVIAATPVSGFNSETGIFTVVGSEVKPSAGAILKGMFHSKEHKLRDLARITGLRPSEVFKSMYDRNGVDSDSLGERIKNVDATTWTFDLKPIPTEAPILPDVELPVVLTAEGLGNAITITFGDINHLNTNTVPNNNKITVTSNGNRINVSKIQIGKNSNALKLFLSSQIKFGDVIAVAYAKPDHIGNQLQDTAKNVIADFACDVTNLTVNPNPAPVETPPVENAPEGDTPPIEQPAT